MTLSSLLTKCDPTFRRGLTSLKFYLRRNNCKARQLQLDKGVADTLIWPITWISAFRIAEASNSIRTVFVSD